MKALRSSVFNMESGSLSRLSAEKLTELKEQVTRILKSREGQCLELHKFKQVYKETFGKEFEAHYRQLKSKKLKDVMKSLDSVTVLEQSHIIQIKLKDQVEAKDSSMSPGPSVSNINTEEESISSGNTTHSPPLSPASPALLKSQYTSTELC